MHDGYDISTNINRVECRELKVTLQLIGGQVLI